MCLVMHTHTVLEVGLALAAAQFSQLFRGVAIAFLDDRGILANPVYRQTCSNTNVGHAIAPTARTNEIAQFP